jgi:hypothetical protein
MSSKYFASLEFPIYILIHADDQKTEIKRNGQKEIHFSI